MKGHEFKEGSVHEVVFDELPLNEVTELVVRKSLIVNDGNIMKTSKALGVSRATLYRMMKKYGLLDNRKSVGGDRSKFKTKFYQKRSEKPSV